MPYHIKFTDTQHTPSKTHRSSLSW